MAQSRAMSELYYQQLDDEDRELIDFVVVNSADALSYKQNLEKDNQRLTVVQDDPTNRLYKSLSNYDANPKDDMALIDKNGRMIAYFDSLQSGMYNSKKNNIRTAVFEVTDKDYVNPCGDPSAVKDTKEDKPKKEGKEAKPKKVKYDAVENLEALKEKCSADKDTCLDCRGKFNKKKGCKLAKRLKCRHMNTEEMCKSAGCQYKKPRKSKPMRCKDSDNSVFN